MDYQNKFETYLQGHIHPEAQPAIRRLTHERLGSMSIEAFLDAADALQASHELFDRDMEAQGVVAGFDATGAYIERTPLAQQDFDRRTH